MRLADFIDANMPAILAEWQAFAASLLPAAEGLDASDLRDHASQVLHTFTRDLRTPQTRAEQSQKSKSRTPLLSGAPESAAQTHALLRVTEGFSVQQLVAEYRALRASVLRLWADAGAHGPEAMEDMGRFNEAVDQAIAESVDFFTTEVERWRALFLGMLGHDLRSPLNAVLLSARVIAAVGAGTSVSPHTERLTRSAERMSQLLDDLLDFNRTSLNIGLRVIPEPIDLTAACADEVDMLRVALPDSPIDFTARGVTEGIWDGSRIKQSISNLVINAAKYGDPGGAIRVRLSADDVLVKLSVENSGPSIPPDLMPSLFEPLRRYALAGSREEHVSLGLGLFIVRQIARAHGGDVTVQSADGHTCFTVMLPVRGPAPAQV